MNYIQKAILIAGAAFCFNLTMSAQDITLKNKNITVKEAMEELKKTSGYSFVFSSKDVNTKKKISISANKASIEEVVNQILKGQTDLTYEIRDKKIIVRKAVSNAAPAQAGKVKGTITDATGMPVIGAAVKEKGTSNGVVSDIDGNFALEVGANATLEISYIGYKTLEVKASQQPMNITMVEDAEMLDEVVVVGYGSQRKSDLTGGITSVKAEQLEMVTSNNLLDKLAGQVPGLSITTSNARPGEEQSLRIRGINSLTASNTPLIVLDGIPYNGSLGDIDPEIIESLSVLKDASSAAIYGSRGSNGVILIQTKKGKQGKAQVTYKGQVGLEQPQSRLNLMDGPEYVRMMQEYYHQKEGWTGDQLDPMYILNPRERENYKNGHETDWQDIVLRNALTNRHTVNITGGTEYTKYSATISNLKQEGVMVNSGMRRTNLSMNIVQDLNSWLQIGVGTQFSDKDIDNNNANYEAAIKMSPYGQFLDEEGHYVDYPMDQTLFANPMADINATVDNKYRNLFLSTFAEVQLPIKGLTYRTNFGYNYRTSFSGSYYGRNTLSGKNVEGSASISNTHYWDYTWENIVNYNLQIKKHKIDLTGLYSLQQTSNQTSSQTAQCFVNDDSEYHNMAAGEKNQKVTSGLTETSTISYMFRANYNYDNRYMLTLTGRTDGYSAFGANNKYAFFPSAAVAWNISSEDFMETLRDSWLDMLKIRVSYGSNGNQAINSYQTLDRLDVSKYIWGDEGTIANGSYLGFSSVGNPNLKWETTHSFNLGIDFSLFHDRLSGTIETYVANTKDLLMSRNVPVMNGFQSIMDNIGQTRNKGVEITLNSVNMQNKDFTWTTNLNFFLNRDEIVELRGDGKDDITNKWFIGEPLRVIYDYNVIGIWQYDDPQYVKKEVNGNIIEGFFNEQGEEIQAGALPGSAKLEDVNKDGKISAADKKVIGSRTPSFLLSMGNRFQYKNISFSFLLNGTFGQWKERHDLNNERWGFIWNNISGKEYWTENNHNDQYTALDYMPYDKHSFYSKVNYVTIKNISLDYHLEKQWIKALGISDASINISVNNLYTFSNIDNAVNMDADNMFVTYPTNRSYMFGLNINF
jgi:TonB-linked SusC/RagA family outer membrane protein